MVNRREFLGASAAVSLMSGISPAMASTGAASVQVPLKEFTEDLNEIIKIDSKTGHAEGVRKVCEVFTKRFKSIGWTVTTEEIGKWGPGFVATNTPDQSKFDVILCGHFDTVQPVGNAAKYPLKIEGTKAHGAGVADDKASITAIWWICKSLPKTTLDNLKICVLISPAEEVGPAEVNDFLLKYGKRGKYAMVYEPGRPDGSFVKVRKSCTWVTLEFKGVAAHAGNNPEDGRNAIDAMTLAVPQVVAMAKDYNGMTINSGMVSGGTAVNTVADNAKVTFDIRTLDSKSQADVLKRIEELSKKEFIAGVKTEMSIPSKMGPMELTPVSEELMKVIDEADAALGQKKKNWLIVGGASDGNALSDAGLGVVDALGVCGGNLHNPETEFIDMETIVPRVRLGIEVLARLAQKH